LRYLQGITAVPALSTIKRDGRDYIWLAETVFTGPDESLLDQRAFRAQHPKAEVYPSGKSNARERGGLKSEPRFFVCVHLVIVVETTHWVVHEIVRGSVRQPGQLR
jgi:hypothetical protein